MFAQKRSRMMGKEEKIWLVAKLKPNKENIAMENLERQNFVFFYPQILSTIKRNLKFKNVIKPLFPNYIFISLSEGNQAWHKLNNTIGVAHIIMFGNKIPVIKEKDMRSLISSLNPMSENINSPTLKVDQLVKIKNGPFTNISGK